MPPPAGKKGPFFKDGRENALHDYVMSQPTENLRNNPTAVLSTIHTFVETKSRMMVFQPAKIERVRQLLAAMDPKPKVIVELGTYVGNSAVAFGSMLQSFHGDSGLDGCQVYSLELDEDFVTIAQDFVDLAGLGGIVQIVPGPAAESLKKLHHEGKLQDVDVLFLDHWEKFYVPDLQVCEDLGLLKLGGLIVADNTDMPGAPDYVEYVKSGGRGTNGIRYESKTYETTDQKGVPNVLEVSTVSKVS